MAVDPEHLADAIAKELAQYTQEVSVAIKEETKKVAAACSRELKSTSPVGYGKTAGRYAKGWKTKVSWENEFGNRVTVYNKTDWQLTHLLENGHALHNGGRSPAIPHIQPARDKAEDAIEKGLEGILRDGH